MRFLNFEIVDESFGIELTNVKEVIAFPKITSSPGAPSYFLGFMSLREQVIPLIDLRIRLGIVPTLTLDTSVIICEANSKTFGLVVDIIHTVVSPDEQDVKDVPAMGGQPGSQFISKVIKGQKDLILLLNVVKILEASQEEIDSLQSATSQLRKTA